MEFPIGEEPHHESKFKAPTELLAINDKHGQHHVHCFGVWANGS
jgi:hypothetical protein